MDWKNDERAIMAALASLSYTHNVTLSTVLSRHLISSDAEEIGTLHCVKTLN